MCREFFTAFVLHDYRESPGFVVLAAVCDPAAQSMVSQMTFHILRPEENGNQNGLAVFHSICSGLPILVNADIQFRRNR